ncbi:MAG: methyltransferase domain-containing protein [archaeon]
MADAKAKELFDMCAGGYDEYLPRFPVYDKVMDIILKNTSIASGAKVLDVGVGTGNVSLRIFNMIPCKITGIDVSCEMMKIAGKKAQAIGADMEFVNVCASEIGLEDTFDLAVAAFSIHHLKEDAKAEAFRRIYRSLKGGGRFILADVTVAVDGDIGSVRRLKHIIDRWSYEAQNALKYIGPRAVDAAFRGMRDVYYRDGEYVETPLKLKSMLKEAGFKLVRHEKPDEKTGYQVFVCDKV